MVYLGLIDWIDWIEQIYDKRFMRSKHSFIN